jgi:hypothetical protein
VRVLLILASHMLIGSAVISGGYRAVMFDRFSGVQDKASTLGIFL